MEKLDYQSVMRQTTTSLYEDEPLSSAIEFMTKNRMGLTPIVNREETFVGMLSGDQVMRALLPKGLSITRGRAGEKELHEALAELIGRLGKAGDQTIHKIMDRHAKVVRPDTPLIEPWWSCQKISTWFPWSNSATAGWWAPFRFSPSSGRCARRKNNKELKSDKHG